MATVVLALVPVVHVPTVGVTVVRLYLGAGIGGAWAVAILSVVLAFVFLVTARGRLDPVSAASIGLGGGTVVVLVAAVWALRVEQRVLFEFPPSWWIEHHRAMVLGASVIVPLASLWLARRLDIV